MMLRTGAMLSAAFLLMFPSSVIVRAGDFEDGLRCWREQDYLGAYNALRRYRQMPNGRNAMVDYMLGTSGCRLEGKQAWGGEYLEWMLYRYPLPEDCRSIVVSALQGCRASSTATGPVPGSGSIDRFAEEIIGASATAHAKTFYRVGHNEAFRNFAATRTRMISPSVIRERLFPLEAQQRAISSTKARVPRYTVKASGHFVFADKTGKSNDDFDRMTLFLERYLAFLAHQFEVALPSVFVTVYLVPTPEDMADLASRLHGLSVGRATMGYSFRDDMSILAVVPSGFTVGTVQHELFHLVVRSTFGDIPQWLDEGIASLYEVSRLDPVVPVPPNSSSRSVHFRCVGLPSWRGNVLQQLWSIRPSITQMITSDWYAFEQPGRSEPRAFMIDREDQSPSADRMAVTLATARYFALYLQERGALVDLYKRMQAQQPGDGPTHDARASAQMAVSEALGEPLDKIDKSFATWFLHLPGIPLTR